MDPVTYYTTTLTNAAKNLGPYIGYAIVGYFLFIKLPFDYLLKMGQENKPKDLDDKKDRIGNPYREPVSPMHEQIDSKVHEERMKERHEEILERERKKQKEREAEKERQDKKRAEREKIEREEEARKNPPKQEVKPSSAEEVFGIRPGETLSKGELKKKYFELIKQNHPDKVADMGDDFKAMAERKTKDINAAYDQLKKKAS